MRLFLTCLVDGVALSKKTKLKFHPNDQVIDIYRSLYGGKTLSGDNMERETFFENLCGAFGVAKPKILAECLENNRVLVKLINNSDIEELRKQAGHKQGVASDCISYLVIRMKW